MINRHNKIATIILGGILAVAMAAGLSVTVNAQDPSTKQAPRDKSKYEAWLTREVRHQLVLLPFYSVFDNLEYKVKAYKVTLLGQVTRPSLKDDAAAAVKKIEGVEQVDNQIEVLPVSPNDDRIRRAEFRAIYSQAPLERYALQAVPPIHIIVKNGHVTLEGVVANEADKNIANVTANGVPDVFSVTNNLRVEK
jgi:hyperosmotically inducible protein